MASMMEEDHDLRKKRLAEEKDAFVDNKRKVMMGAFNHSKQAHSNQVVVFKNDDDDMPLK